MTVERNDIYHHYEEPIGRGLIFLTLMIAVTALIFAVHMHSAKSSELQDMRQIRLEFEKELETNVLGRIAAVENQNAEERKVIEAVVQAIRSHSHQAPSQPAVAPVIPGATKEQ